MAKYFYLIVDTANSYRFRALSHCLLLPLLLLNILLINSVQAQPNNAATTKQNKTIRIGINSTVPPFTFVLPNGRPTGLFVEIWQTWADINHHTVVFVPLTHEQSIVQLKSGEIDMQAGLFINDKRAAWADFSVAIAQVNSKLFYHDEIGKDLTLEALSGEKVGVGPGTFQDNYLISNYPGVIKTYLTVDGDFVDKILSGDVSAVISEEPVMNGRLELAGLKGTIVSSQEAILTNTVHGTFLKDNLYLKSIVNAGFRNIPIATLRIMEKKWIPDSFALFKDYEIKLAGLTLAEHEWIATNLNFSLGVSPSLVPLEWLDELNLHQGISADYVNILNDLLSIEMKPKRNLSWPEIIAGIKNKKIDVIPAIVKTKSRASFINFTKPYISIPLVIASTKDSEPILSLSDLQGKIVAVGESTPTEELLKRDHPNLILLPVDDDVITGMTLLETNEVDAYVTGAAPIIYHLNSGDFNNVKIAAYTDYKLEIAMGIRKGLEPLQIILDKALDSITAKEKAKIYNSWLTVRIDTGTKFTTFLLWALPVLSVLIATIFIFFRMNQRLKIEIEGRKESEKVQQMLVSQLHQSQKMEALGKLTGGIAHDFNNMLSVILGYSDLLTIKSHDEKQLAIYVEHISHAAERGAKLTKKLLSFTKQETTEATQADINKLLRQQLDVLQKTLTVRVKITLKLDEGIWPIWLESSDLEDAILNMAINAMHAMNDDLLTAELIFQTGNVALTEGYAGELGLVPGDYVKLSIIDNGRGMSKEISKQIFDPFFSTKGHNGTGLGLSQVFGFVQRSSGSIVVETSLEQGTNFSLYFPKHVTETETESTQEEPKTQNLRGIETILIVDDESALSDLAVYFLQREGYKMLVAESGKSALMILEEQQVDLVLTDVVMPEMDGYQLSEEIRENHPGIKIQLLSGFADEKTSNFVDEDLKRNLIHKPYNRIQLLQSVRTLLDC
ncbi:MAG: ABC-type amino acid transport substrate-binding protein [Candidatus Azotimanducaceae bacterium]|jgi:ABC-type amino acid transport substrate-binding protein/nitrogen-specific signal transduction histidine kinase/CheY-like chemotaxis protein